MSYNERGFPWSQTYNFLRLPYTESCRLTMLMSKDAVLVATSVVLAVSTIFSVSVQLERQYKTAGRLNASKCELQNLMSTDAH